MKQLLLLVLTCMALPAVSQFKQLRYDEDYHSLAADTSHHWYRKIKYSRIGNNVYASAGGDIRYQYFYFHNENWGDAPDDKDGFVMSRYLLHGDIHVGKHFRAFAQLQSSQVNGKPTTTPVDEDPLEVHQAFADVLLGGKKTSWLLRMGRQELLYGSQRLISVRDGPNNRQSFDGAKLVVSQGMYQADLLYMHPTRTKKGLFDDGYNRDARLWGVHTSRSRANSPFNADLYYWGLRKTTSAFDAGVGREMRHSIGSRLWNTKRNWRYDVEGLWQFGKFDEQTIAAWTLSVNTGYRFADVKFRPEVGVKTEWISGDAQYGDDKLQTFNPLFPRGGYFGLAAIIGPSNLFDVHPSVNIDLCPKVFLNIDYDIFWRYSVNDGLYGPGGQLIYTGKGTGSKFAGKQLSFDVSAVPNQFWYLRAEFTFFRAGDFLKEVGSGKDMLFAGLTAQFKF